MKKIYKRIIYIILTILIIIILLLIFSKIISEELLELPKKENNTLENSIGNTTDIPINNTSKIDTNTIIDATDYIEKENDNIIETPSIDIEEPTEPVEPIEPVEPTKPAPPKPEELEVVPDVYTILSENKQWQEIETLNIFKNEYYTNATIAPGIEGIYQFDINNGLVSSMNSAIQFEEINNKNINMKYKIKLGNRYLVSNWTNIEDIELPILNIPSRIRVRYTIEWKWEDSENDTEIGLSADEAEYNLKILVTSTENQNKGE